MEFSSSNGARLMKCTRLISYLQTGLAVRRTLLRVFRSCKTLGRELFAQLVLDYIIFGTADVEQRRAMSDAHSSLMSPLALPSFPHQRLLGVRVEDLGWPNHPSGRATARSGLLGPIEPAFSAVRGLFLAIGLIVASKSHADPNVASSTLNQHLGYLGASVGEPTSPQGAQVTISAERAGVSDYGGVIYTTSAQAWINQVVRVSALLGAASPNAKPWLWVRADGSSGRSLRFATSAGRPASADGYTNIDLRIPPDATSVAFGVAMRGAGEVVAKDVKLAISEQKIPGSEASAEQVYSEALKVVLDNAYRSSNLPKNLHDLKPELSSRPGTGYQAEKSVRALLRQLKDSHSIYVSAEEAYRYSNSGGNPDLASVSLIDGKVGYVLMPAVGGTDPELALKFSTEIGRKLRDINPQARCGWVVDLRTNTGGSMWPMVSALGLFFGDERLGGFKAGNGSINWWSMSSRWVTPVAGQSEAHDARIAVLLGSRTASSGEAVAVAFIGREGTQSFGMATSGKASSNRKFPLPDGSAIYLTTAVDVDRSGREVGERVVPDILLSEEVVSRSEVPKEALDWLTTSCPFRKQ